MFAKLSAIGRLGRDPETKPNGPCRFSIAVSRSYTKKGSDEKVEKTEWLRITAWGKLGENCQRFLEKGRLVYIEGEPQTSSYEKDGVTRYTTEYVASMVDFLPKGAPKGEGGEDAAEPSTGAPDSGDDDIPF